MSSYAEGPPEPIVKAIEMIGESSRSWEDATHEIIAEAQKTLREITRWRRTYQPGGTLNAGSVFRNPPGDAAGRIIDELGLKGFRVGGAAVSAKHANFFEADPDASAQDVYDLVRTVQAIVADKTGIELVPEVQFAGRFESPQA